MIGLAHRHHQTSFMISLLKQQGICDIWKRQDLNCEKDLEEWKAKYTKITNKINHHSSNLV